MPSKKAKRDYYYRNREAINKKERERKYIEYQKNPEIFKARTRKWHNENPAHKLWLQARARARRNGLEFTISIEDIFIPEFCPYLGIPLTHQMGKGWVKSNVSLDRIDTTKGYTKENIQVISWLANSMKRDATREELIMFAKGILKIYSFPTIIKLDR